MSSKTLALETTHKGHDVKQIPILPLRNAVVYPLMPHQLTAGRQRSIRALEAAAENDNIIGLFSQRDGGIEDPTKADLYRVGTLAKIVRLWRMPDDSVRLIVQGQSRARLEDIVTEKPFISGRVRRLKDKGDPAGMPIKALGRTVSTQFQAIVDLSAQLPDELKVVAVNMEDPGRLADFVTFYVDVHLEEKQEVLELLDMRKRLEYVTTLLAREQEILEVGASIQSQVQEKVGKSQREYYLREQLKQIQKELSGSDPLAAENDELRSRIDEADLSEEAAEAAQREVGRLEHMMPGAPEYSLVRTYLDWLLDLPWNHGTEDQLNIRRALRILDEDHYGLSKVKERVLEYLAVRHLRQEIKGPILCFVGPPGVGKTSLGRSIARAMGRSFTRISLGGVHDEAEIRGHRRTYIGALPGRIIQGIKKAGSNNPVFMLDEIDKLGSDFRGDPGSALLEVLDPEQNFSFADNYLDVPFDLSKVLFITTANLMSPVPPALRDRMEEIPIPGYTPDEKISIAQKHLLSRQRVEHGITENQLKISDRTMLRMIREFTHEAGLRNLERSLGTICRKLARRFVESGSKRSVSVSAHRLEEYLGPAQFFPEVAARKPEVGVATGLAATAAGGEILFIEATRMPGGKKQLILTGRLGEVMRESAQTALSYLRARSESLGISPEDFDCDIHLHVPAGATPKEGPSAGVALAVALVSLFSGRRIRSDVAMTGEITLRGRVLPVGGIRDKVLAAQRAGIRAVILPARNEKDLEEVPARVKEQIEFHAVEHFDQALEVAEATTRRRKSTSRKSTPRKKKG
jgi:ATP-dependent Lon protease